ncbi:MAG: thiamine pyrophosphate-binding protein [Nitriliruptoraceae bacterium]
MAAQLHGGRLIADHLVDEGVDALFTLTGGHISPIYDGCKDRDITVIDVRHEQAAAHAADAYARLTLRPGVAAVTAGPGVTDAITGVTNAFYANSPMVLLGGRNPLSLDGMGALQDAPQLELLRPVTKRADTALETRRLREVLGWSFRDALAPRMGPTYLDLPLDVLMTPVEADQVVPSLGQRATAPAGPDPDTVATVARLLGDAEQPVVISGSGTYWAQGSQALDQLASTAQLPVYVNGMSRGILPSTHPHLLGLTRKHALRQADLVIALGVDFDFRLGFGRPPAYRDDVVVVQVDPQADRIGHNRAVDHGVVSDVASFLRALLDHDAAFGRSEPSAWLTQLREEEARRLAARDEAAGSDASPVHPLRFAREVARWADPEAIVIGDGGDIVAHTAGQVRVDHPGHWMDPGPFGCLGVGAPFALAARHVHPDRQVLVVYGDGSFGFNAMEFESAVRQDLPFVGVVGNDGAWGEMKAFHERVYGAEGMVAQDLAQDVGYEGMVTALGGYGERVERPEDIGPALDRAAASGVPALVNVLLDRDYRRESAAAYGA